MLKTLLFVLNLIALVIAFALWGMNGEQPIYGGALVVIFWALVLLSFDVLIPE